MTVTTLRFGTACGMSPRLRLDLVLNDFVACALATGEVAVLSDGSPWRPLIDVNDMARAVEWALGRDEAAGGRTLAVNTGCDAWNFQVKDLASAVAAAVPGTRVRINRDAAPDRRSYKVDFSLFRALAPQHQPRARLEQTIDELAGGLRALAFSDKAFRSSQFMRLKVLERHIAAGLVDGDLKWLD
jgi:nucleoside-diphosphate-sugar epimerase